MGKPRGDREGNIWEKEKKDTVVQNFLLRVSILGSFPILFGSFLLYIYQLCNKKFKFQGVK
jgi:hypothetical protein